MHASQLLVYGLCILTSALCALLLVRQCGKRHDRLLLWSSLYFVFLCLNSVLVFFDYILPLQYDLTIPRAFASLAAVCAMLYGFIWELS
jgi:cytochrome bd-type quinol oxidase subunit 2